MTTVRVFVNARGIDVPSASTALDAVCAADAVEGAAVAAGLRLIADSRGLPVSNDTPVYAGVIYRVVTNRPRVTEDAS
jgi:hypothetical protein